MLPDSDSKLEVENLQRSLDDASVIYYIPHQIDKEYPYFFIFSLLNGVPTFLPSHEPQPLKNLSEIQSCYVFNKKLLYAHFTTDDHSDYRLLNSLNQGSFNFNEVSQRNVVYKDQTLTKLTLMPCFHPQTFPFALAVNMNRVVVFNVNTGKMFTLFLLRKLHVNDEVDDFRFTYRFKEKTQTASELAEIRIHYKEETFDQNGNREALHYVQMVLDRVLIESFTQLGGIIPRSKQEMFESIREHR
jgi:hypothetical protein